MFLVPTTLIFHTFPVDAGFFMNLALIGSLILAITRASSTRGVSGRSWRRCDHQSADQLIEHAVQRLEKGECFHLRGLGDELRNAVDESSKGIVDQVELCARQLLSFLVVVRAAHFSG